MTDLISPRARKIAGLIVTVAVGVLALAMEWSDLGPEFTLWSRRAFAILVVVSNAFGLSVTLPKVRAAGAAVMMIVLAMVVIMASACKMTTHDVAVHMVRGLQQTRNLTGSQLGAAMRITYASCKAKHPGDKPALKACIKPALDLQAKWKGIIRPVVDTTAQSGKAVLQTKAVVDKCKREKNCDKVIFAIIKPGACAILRGLTAFGHLLADKGAAILASLGIFEGVICD